MLARTALKATAPAPIVQRAHFASRGLPFRKLVLQAITVLPKRQSARFVRRVITVQKAPQSQTGVHRELTAAKDKQSAQHVQKGTTVAKELRSQHPVQQAHSVWKEHQSVAPVRRVTSVLKEPPFPLSAPKEPIAHQAYLSVSRAQPDITVKQDLPQKHLVVSEHTAKREIAFA